MTHVDQHLANITLAGQRPESVETRRRVLRALSKQLQPRALNEATRGDLEMFLGRDLAAATRKAYLAHLRGYYRWALDDGLIAEDPTLKLPSVRVPLGVPRPVERPDVEVALRHADPRMRAWLLLMTMNGLRSCEVAALHPSDLISVEGHPVLFLREPKGGGTASVPAHEAVVEALLALRVENGLWWMVKASTVSRAVSKHLRGLGIDATGHQLRHTAATAWYRASGHDLLTTARLLRHANVATTQIYSQLDPRRPAEVVNLVPLPSAS